MFEFVMMSIFITVITAIVTVAFYFLFPGDIDGATAAIYAVVGVCMGLPGIANLCIAVNPKSPEDRYQKIIAFVRGVGMIMIGLGLIECLSKDDYSGLFVALSIGIGLVFHIGSMIADDMYRAGPSEKAGANDKANAEREEDGHDKVDAE